MLKGRNKTFAPKRIVRSAPRNGAASPAAQAASSPRQILEPSQSTHANVDSRGEITPTTSQNTKLNNISETNPRPTERTTSPSPHPRPNSPESTDTSHCNPKALRESKRHAEDGTTAPGPRPIPSESILTTREQPQSVQAPSDLPNLSESQNSTGVELGVNRELGPTDRLATLTELSTQDISSAYSCPDVSTTRAPRSTKKTPRKARAKDSDATVDISSTNATGGKPRKTPGRKKYKKRERTPEGAEDEMIDTSVVTMQDLCKDLRIGRKSRHHDEIMARTARHKREAMKAKMLRDFPELADLISTEGDDTQTQRAELPVAATSSPKNSPPPRPAAGLKMRIVDGQIVTDEQSLRIDLHQHARENAVEEEVIEENDFSRIVNSNNYLKRERSQHWDALSNELFWKGLRMFGTDFEMIAKMFPNRSRRQIKLKFNAEERRNPRQLNRVLMGIKTEEIDLEEFQRLGNVELEDLAIIRAEEKRIETEQSEQLQVIEQAKLEETRRRKAEILGASATARALDGYSDDELFDERDKTRPKKRKKNMHSAYGGGEEVIVLETHD